MTNAEEMPEERLDRYIKQAAKAADYEEGFGVRGYDLSRKDSWATSNRQSTTEQKENDRLVEEKRLEFRIGVNIGDVVQDEDRIYGDGVNIAARIEGLADPAGICVSRSAYDQIKKKLADAGINNIARRTVAKYRNLLNIPAARLRKKF